MKLEELSIFHKPEEGRYFYGKFGGNYCSIHFEGKGQINYFQFGIDITLKETEEFIKSILKIGQNQKFIFLGSDLNTFETKWIELDKYFRNTSAYKLWFFDNYCKR